MNRISQPQQFFLLNKPYRHVIFASDVFLDLLAEKSDYDPDSPEIWQASHPIENVRQNRSPRDRQQGLRDCMRVGAKSRSHTSCRYDDVDHRVHFIRLCPQAYQLQVDSGMTMDTDLHKFIFRYYEELWNSWRYDLISELLSDTIEFRGSLGITVTGRDGFRKYMDTVRGAFPDFHNTIIESICEGDRVAARLNYTGTHRGEILGVPATGRRIEYSGAAIFHVSCSQITSGWVIGDTTGLLNQLTVASSPV